MSGRQAPQLGVTDKRDLVQFANDGSRLPREALRAEMVLRVAAGATDQQVAAQVGASPATVAAWRERYTDEGIDGLQDRPRPGRPRVISAAPGEASGADRESDDGDALGPEPQETNESIEHLLRAARRTISRRGFISTRVADIAAEAGVSPATVHYHFKTREDILIRTLLWTSAGLVNDLEPAGGSDEPPLPRIAKLLERTMPYAGSQEDEYRLEIDLLAVARNHPELLEPYEDYARRWIDHVRKIVEEGVESGDFTISVSAADAAERLVGLTDGLSMQAAIGAERMPTARVRDLVLEFAAQQLGIDIGELYRHAPGFSAGTAAGDA